MSENYQVVLDEEQLKKFADWLPDLCATEALYVCLMARNKYVRDTADIPNIKSDKYQCRRFTSNKEALITKIRQLECPLGAYQAKGVSVPQEALAAYICVNPRDQVKATSSALKRMADLMVERSITHNVHQEAMSCIHKSPGMKHFVDFDFDYEEGVTLKDTIAKVAGFMNHDAISVIETRGGFHVLVRVVKIEKQFVKSWYNNMVKLPGVDIVGDNMIPIPGTYQGGFCPKLYTDINEILKQQ